MVSLINQKLQSKGLDKLLDVATISKLILYFPFDNL